MEKNSFVSTGRVTLKDVANEARVSVASVSAVLGNRQIECRIGQATGEKIRAVASMLGYLPNIGARQLRRGNTRTTDVVVAFVTSDMAPFNNVNRFVHALTNSATGSSKQTRARSFSLIVEFFKPDRLQELPGLLTGSQFNAAVIANTTPLDDRYLSRIHLPYPVVLVNRTVSRFSCVCEAPNTGGEAAEILVNGIRRKKIAVLHGTPTTQATQTRVDSFIAATVRLLGRPAQVIAARNLSEIGGYEAMSQFLNSGERIDGLYCVSDHLALGAYHAIARCRLGIPRDIAVIGTGDHQGSAFYSPPLSWVGASKDLIGEEVSRLLLEQIDHPGRDPKCAEIPVCIKLRESTGHRGEF